MYCSNLQGFLSLLRERFSSRSSSRGVGEKSTGSNLAGNFELKASANNTPEMVRRQIQITESADIMSGVGDPTETVPEIVRIRTTACSGLEEKTESVVRHGRIEESLSCDVSTELRTVSGANTLTQDTNSTKVKLDQMPNRQVSNIMKALLFLNNLALILQYNCYENCFRWF